MRDRIVTRHGFPPAPAGPVCLPPAVPWEQPIAELTGLWIARRCRCGRTSLHPLRRLAADHGWHTTLSRLVPRIKCSECGGRESETLELVDDPTAGTSGRIGGGPRRALDLRQ